VFFWATQYWAIEIAAPHASPIVITALRTLPAALVLVGVVLVLGRRLPPRHLLAVSALTGVLMVALTLGGISEGAARAGGGNTAILVNSSPFFIVLFGRLFFGERLSGLAAVGLAGGFAGVVMIVSPQLGSGDDTADVALGMGLALAAAIGWAVGTLIVKRLTDEDPTLDLIGLTALQYVVGGALLVAIAFGAEPVGTTDWGSGELWGAILWISLGASALAYLTFYVALKRLRASTAGAWLFLVPVVAVIIDAGRGTVPGAVVLVGMALVVAGVALVNVAQEAPAGRVARPVTGGR
jgi:drug/metabolite transporter (DMT)-like permease